MNCEIYKNWLPDTRWGLMFHYLDKPASSNINSVTTSDEWNRRIDKFDVSRFVSQVKETGAGYVIFTLGQNTGFFCSPNGAYDEIVGSEASKLSRRDLIWEIASALLPHIKLIAYLPSHAPAHDSEAVKRFQLVPPWEAAEWGLSSAPEGSLLADDRLTEFQIKWERVIAEWGARWADKVAGWWIDGCYFAKAMYDHGEAPNFESFIHALRIGNPHRILAFNSGTTCPFERVAPEQDYTAGEVSNQFPVSNKWEPLNRNADDMQTHVLTYLGNWWGEGDPRFQDEFVSGYTLQVNKLGGVVTWDVPINVDGSIQPAFLQQLRCLPKRPSSQGTDSGSPPKV
jgi:hypothetical protein